MISDAKKMFSWYNDKTKFFLPRYHIFFRDFFFKLQEKNSRNNERNFRGKEEKVLSLHQENIFLWTSVNISVRVRIF